MDEMTLILNKVAKLKQKCGELCSDEFRHKRMEKEFAVNNLTASVDCRDMFEIMLMDDVHIKKPPPLKKIPKSLLVDYSYGDQFNMTTFYWNDNYATNEMIRWNRTDIDELVRRYQTEEGQQGLGITYFKGDEKDMIQTLKSKFDVKGAKVLVLGSRVIHTIPNKGISNF